MEPQKPTKRDYSVGIILSPSNGVLLQKKGEGYPWKNSETWWSGGKGPGQGSWIPSSSGAYYFGLFGGGMKDGETSEQTFAREKREEGLELLSGKAKDFLSQEFAERTSVRMREGTLNYFVVRFDGNIKNFRDKEAAGLVLACEEEVRGYFGGMIFKPNLDAILTLYDSLKEGIFQV
ncbi:NUDIX domain-containing protein [Candidatus Pacearchaeota archaeon]|nr:NUDIX domain-containing protein [Candidatus Pacearchaeota archaeon]